MLSRFSMITGTATGTQALVEALAESRERWRMLVQDGADMAFETDEAGRFVLLTPARVLGWPSDRLLGTAAELLLLRDGDAPATALFNPFRTRAAVRRRRVWLRDAGGMPMCLLISSAPIANRPGAVRGIGIDITEQQHRDCELASLLLRRETATIVSQRMQRVAVPFASLTVGLAELIGAVNARGAALILHEHDAPLRVAAKSGEDWPGEIDKLQEAVMAICEQPPTWMRHSTQQSISGGQSLLLCAGTNHFIDRAVIALWRESGAWSKEEEALVACLLPAIQPILEHEQIQRETARLSRTDILTSLLNRQGFVTELSRRMERLDREGLQATLMVVGLDKLANVNDRTGVERGDAILRGAATSLRDMVRPTDLVARLGGDLFAIWLDGADQFTAAERADLLRRTGMPIEGGDGRMTVSVGLAVRSSRSFESIESLLHRAWNAMHAIKQAGGGNWQVSNEEPGP